MASNTQKEKLKHLIQTARGTRKADLVIKNCKIADVFNGMIVEGDIAIAGDKIAGIGDYEGNTEIDAQGRYAVPGFIDTHIHIESSYLSPEELGRLLVPHGTTTIITDPHEIVNVCGMDGLNYMMEAAKNTKLDIKFVLPSCVPATPWEHSGAVIDAPAMAEPILRENIIGLGEFMSFPGVIAAEEGTLDKLLTAKNAGKLIDGHSPGLTGKALNAYCAARIQNDHECSSIEDMQERIRNGMYVMLREGSACHDLRTLMHGITPENSRRCILCSDDRQPKTIFHEGHLDHHMRILANEGKIDPISILRMASLNAAECFHLYDRGAIAPGYRADIVLVNDLKAFSVNKVWIAGELVSEKGKYLPEVIRYDTSTVQGSIHLKDFSKEKFKMHLKSNLVNVIEIVPGGVLTQKATETIALDENGEFIRDPQTDIIKIAVVERHQMTGNVACGFLKGYGLKAGAIAISIAHDSHNIIVTGANDTEMACAVKALKAQGGGIVLIKDGQILENMPMPIAGLMSDRDGHYVEQKLDAIHEKAHSELHVNPDVEPVMTLTFMSLAVIPEIKLTDMGLFDVTSFSFIPVEAEK